LEYLIEIKRKGCENMSETIFVRVEPSSEFLQLKDGEEVVGRYVGNEISMKYDDQYNYKIEIKDVGVKKLMGCAVLDTLFANVTIGALVKIIYKGKSKTKKGVDFNNYEVWQDKNAVEEIIGLDGTKHVVQKGKI
jgi:hypothetical protein